MAAAAAAICSSVRPAAWAAALTCASCSGVSSVPCCWACSASVMVGTEPSGCPSVGAALGAGDAAGAVSALTSPLGRPIR